MVSEKTKMNSSIKKLKISDEYGDMRIEAALIIKEMWLNLGRYKSEFIPALVGDVFSVTLIKVTEIRREILFLLFDMINFETLSSRQFKFEKFQEAIVSATDVYFNQNLGDQSYVEACFHLPDHQIFEDHSE